MQIKNLKAQSLMEYLILFAIIAVVLLIVLSPGGLLKKGIEDSLDTMSNGIIDMAENINYESNAD